MPRNEHLTRVELIDPVLDGIGWPDDSVRAETTQGSVDVDDGHIRKRKGRMGYLLCLPIAGNIPPLDHHCVHHLLPAGMAGVVRPNRSTASKLSNDGVIRCSCIGGNRRSRHEGAKPGSRRIE